MPFGHAVEARGVRVSTGEGVVVAVGLGIAVSLGVAVGVAVGSGVPVGAGVVWGVPMLLVSRTRSISRSSACHGVGTLCQANVPAAASSLALSEFRARMIAPSTPMNSYECPGFDT